MDCTIHHDNEVKGTIKLKINFTSYPYETLSFKMVNALVIHKPSEDLSKRKIFVRTEIGE